MENVVAIRISSTFFFPSFISTMGISFSMVTYIYELWRQSRLQCLKWSWFKRCAPTLEKNNLKKTFPNLEREKKIHGLQQMEALESLQAPAAANCLWPVGKASPVSQQNLGLSSALHFEREGLPIKHASLLYSKHIATNTLLQVHLFWHISPFYKHSSFCEKMPSQETWILQCLNSAALEERRIVDEKLDGNRNKKKRKQKSDIRVCWGLCFVVGVFLS